MSRVTQPPSFWSRHSRSILCLALLLLGVHDIFGAHGFMAMRRTQRDMDQIQANIAKLDKENTDLNEQVTALKTDPKTIERIAREEIGLARPGEKIFKLPPPVEGSQNASGKH